ncbi:MAG: pyridoxamine 5'-phosphate oxidase family protein [Methanothrix sp.]|nr:pyridoxamine 5'-phosphate oxidase family protein [Methanothrix sp.]
MSLIENILKVTGGECVAALATIQEGKPAVRFMALFGLDDLTMIGATMKSSRKVEQIKRNPQVALTIWSGKNFNDPYVMMQGKGYVHEDLETKKKFWNPKMEVYFQKPENPEYVVLKFVPQSIEYYHDMNIEVWEG